VNTDNTITEANAAEVQRILEEFGEAQRFAEELAARTGANVRVTIERDDDGADGAGDEEAPSLADLQVLGDLTDRALRMHFEARAAELASRIEQAYDHLVAARRMYADTLDEHAADDAQLATARADLYARGALLGPDGKPGRNDAERELIERTLLRDRYTRLEAGRAMLAVIKAEMAADEAEVERVRLLARLYEALLT